MGKEKEADKPKAKEVKVVTTRLGGSWIQQENGSLIPNGEFAEKVDARAKAKAARLKKQNQG